MLHFYQMDCWIRLKLEFSGKFSRISMASSYDKHFIFCFTFFVSLQHYNITESDPHLDSREYQKLVSRNLAKFLIKNLAQQHPPTASTVLEFSSRDEDLFLWLPFLSHWLFTSFCVAVSAWQDSHDSSMQVTFNLLLQNGKFQNSLISTWHCVTVYLQLLSSCEELASSVYQGVCWSL